MQCPVEAFPHIIQVFTKCIDRVCNVHGCFNKTVLILREIIFKELYVIIKSANLQTCLITFQKIQ